MRVKAAAQDEAAVKDFDGDVFGMLRSQQPCFGFGHRILANTQLIWLSECISVHKCPS